ncbi:MAG: protein-tyrosine-phosphatase, partial [Saprospiraceae bacterium]
MGNLLPPIDSYCYELQKETSLIPTTRQQLLQRLSDYIISRLRQQKQAQITIICTHNSRRSHLAQLWLAVIADFLQIADIQTFSGGTEATALNPRVVTALKKVGFEVTT